MKSAILCQCGKLVKKSESYAVKITSFEPDKEVIKKVRLCRACTRKAGYKVRVIKKPIKKEIANAR